MSVSSPWIVAIALAVVVLVESPPARALRLLHFPKLALEPFELAGDFFPFVLFGHIPLLLLAGNYPTPIAPAASTYGQNR